MVYLDDDDDNDNDKNDDKNEDKNDDENDDKNGDEQVMAGGGTVTNTSDIELMEMKTEEKKDDEKKDDEKKEEIKKNHKQPSLSKLDETNVTHFFDNLSESTSANKPAKRKSTLSSASNKTPETLPTEDEATKSSKLLAAFNVEPQKTKKRSSSILENEKKRDQVFLVVWSELKKIGGDYVEDHGQEDEDDDDEELASYIGEIVGKRKLREDYMSCQQFMHLPECKYIKIFEKNVKM